MKQNIEILNSKGFVDEFLNQYLKDGFGSMSKNSLDVLLFHLLMEYGNLKNKSFEEISLILRIPVSKVKRLYYESRLKYDQSWNLKDFIKNILMNGLFEISEDLKIVLMVEDPFIRQNLESELKKEKLIYDYSFSRSILKISVYKFVDFLKKQNIIDKVEETDSKTWNLIKQEFINKIDDPNIRNELLKIIGEDLNFFQKIEGIISKLSNTKTLKLALKTLAFFF